MLCQQAGHRWHDFGCIVGRGSQEFVCAFLAEMELVRLAVDKVGDMERCRFIALLAFHLSLTSARTIARPGAPSCNTRIASEGGTSGCEAAIANVDRGILAK